MNAEGPSGRLWALSCMVLQWSRVRMNAEG